jgi:hypothetical protein
MAALILVDPKAAAKQVLDAFVKAKTSRRGAADILGCNERTFANWAKALKVDLDKVEARAKREGWHHGRHKLGGRPPGSKNRSAAAG